MRIRWESATLLVPRVLYIIFELGVVPYKKEWIFKFDDANVILFTIFIHRIRLEIFKNAEIEKM